MVLIPITILFDVNVSALISIYLGYVHIVPATLPNKITPTTFLNVLNFYYACLMSHAFIPLVHTEYKMYRLMAQRSQYYLKPCNVTYPHP